ncbi:2123_t:CDS:2 [Ambispora leptoticha]|uniref:2123_t:CDS:1 n=1 Tax=Ambispora leptoticha TaxID=144679 RepID=A0A9N9EMQ9_9GLOM|nr:2123_t:CDS:2 [Ambispora leptoticha]
MNAEFIDALSRDFGKLLLTPTSSTSKSACNNHDVIIEVGKPSNKKSFNAHSIILSARSEYFRNALKINGKESRQVEEDFVEIAAKKTHFKRQIINLLEPNIIPEYFKILLNYIYTGKISFEPHNPDVVLYLLESALYLKLTDLYDFLQTHLVEDYSKWLEEKYELIRNIIEANDGRDLKILTDFCAMIQQKKSEAIFKSEDFAKLDKDLLITLLKYDALDMDEIEIWDRVLEWCLARLPNLNKSLAEWSDSDFKLLRIAIEPFIPHIRFFQIPAAALDTKILQYQKSFPECALREILSFHLRPGYVPTILQLLPPRIRTHLEKIPDYKTIDSLIIDDSHVNWLSNSIENLSYDTINNNFEYKLLLRGSRDGFTSAAFYNICVDNGPTIIVIKIAGIGELIGGYNPLNWSSFGGFMSASNAFIFNLGKQNLQEAVLSRIVQEEVAVWCGRVWSGQEYGPCFGLSDLSIIGKNWKAQKISFCNPASYEKQILSTTDYFSFEEYEVFQIVRK